MPVSVPVPPPTVPSLLAPSTHNAVMLLPGGHTVGLYWTLSTVHRHSGHFVGYSGHSVVTEVITLWSVCDRVVLIMVNVSKVGPHKQESH